MSSYRAAAALSIKHQLKELHRNPPIGYSAGLLDDDLFYWSVIIIGPPNTLYEGGYFKAILIFPEEYPLRPPTLRFISEIWHPNIYLNGEVCMSILQDPNKRDLIEGDPSEHWLPVYTVDTIMLFVLSLLKRPNDTSPANAKAARQWRFSKGEFKKNVVRCVRKSQEEL